jgi:hypothetical protein
MSDPELPSEDDAKARGHDRHDEEEEEFDPEEVRHGTYRPTGPVGMHACNACVVVQHLRTYVRVYVRMDLQRCLPPRSPHINHPPPWIHLQLFDAYFLRGTRSRSTDMRTSV